MLQPCRRLRKVVARRMEDGSQHLSGMLIFPRRSRRPTGVPSEWGAKRMNFEGSVGFGELRREVVGDGAAVRPSAWRRTSRSYQDGARRQGEGLECLARTPPFSSDSRRSRGPAREAWPHTPVPVFPYEQLFDDALPFALHHLFDPGNIHQIDSDSNDVHAGSTRRSHQSHHHWAKRSRKGGP